MTKQIRYNLKQMIGATTAVARLLDANREFCQYGCSLAGRGLREDLARAIRFYKSKVPSEVRKPLQKYIDLESLTSEVNPESSDHISGPWLHRGQDSSEGD